MGRELRRVPFDFDWPLNKRWDGFVNPHHKPCPENNKTCFNGETAAGQWLDAVLRIMSVIAEEGAYAEIPKEHRNPGRLFPHPYLVEFPQAPTPDTPPEIREQGSRAVWRWWETRLPGDRIVHPTTEFTKFFLALCETKSLGPIFGGADTYTAKKRILALAGVDPETWGICPVCHGDAMDPAVQEAYEAWEPTPPPVGEGWQLWETVSEGSPISPVFANANSLIDWMAGNGFSREAAASFINGLGWAPSGISFGGEFMNGVEGLHALAQEAQMKK